MSQAEDFVQETPSAITTVKKRVLARIFQHPLSHNLSWREVQGLFETIGTVEPGHNGDLVLKMGTEQQLFTPAHDKDLVAEDVMALRHLLIRTGWSPGGAPTVTPDLTAADLVIVIDHEGARIYPLGPDHGETVHELHHLYHDTDRTPRDADRDEAYPADIQFFSSVAAAVAGEGRIVVVGHGKGQSNEADHLMAYLIRHNSPVHARVAREIVVDLPHVTTPQVLELARHALQHAEGPVPADAP